MTVFVLILLPIATAGLFYGMVRIAKDPVLGVCIFVFLSAITMTPRLPVVGDRLIAADFVMIFTILICVSNGQFFIRPPSGLKLVDKLAKLFIVLATLSSILALGDTTDPVRVFVFSLIFIYGYCCFRLIIRLVDSPIALRRVLLWWWAGAILVILVGFLAATGIYKPVWTYDPIINRINSTFKSSGQIASYLGPAMFILFYQAAVKEISAIGRYLSIALLFAGAFVLLSAGSRIGFAIMIFSMSIGMLIVLFTKSARVKRLPLLTAMVAATVGFVSFTIATWTNKSEVYGLTTTSPIERAIKIFSEQARDPQADLATLGGTRYDEISAALDNMFNHLFFGTGSGLFSSTYQLNEIHNTYVSILAENGILAFVIFAMWWAVIVRIVWRSASRARGNARLMLQLTLSAFAALLIYQLTTNGMRQRPFWFVPALSLSAVVVLRQRPKKRRHVLPVATQ